MKSNLFVAVFALCLFGGLFLGSAVSFSQSVSSQNINEGSAVQIPQSDESYLTGYELQTYCASGYDTDFGYCAGYVTGVADLMFEHNLYGLTSCHNKYIRSQQLVDLVKMYMKKNPDSLGGNARFIVAQALSSGYPCF